ncbi:MAG: UMP kinase [Pseudomonadota bacterium]
MPIYHRVLLKLSGEALEGDDGCSIETKTLDAIASEIQEVRQLGVEVAIVLGGGNLFRGITGAATGMDRTAADTMGMLATLMNCLAMQDALARRGLRSSVMSAIPVIQVCDPFTQRQAIARLEAGEVILLAAGTGNPYFTTDTAAALRALEIGADVLLKATKVDGIFDKDPEKHDDAILFDEISYGDIVNRRLRVMDLTAITLCRDNGLPVTVFNLNKRGNIRRVITGEPIGTRVIESSQGGKEL